MFIWPGLWPILSIHSSWTIFDNQIKYVSQICLFGWELIFRRIQSFHTVTFSMYLVVDVFFWLQLHYFSDAFLVAKSLFLDVFFSCRFTFSSDFYFVAATLISDVYLVAASLFLWCLFDCRYMIHDWYMCLGLGLGPPSAVGASHPQEFFMLNYH